MKFIKNMGPGRPFRQRIEEAKNSFLFEIDVLKRDYRMDEPGAEDEILSGDSQKASAVWGSAGAGELSSGRVHGAHDPRGRAAPAGEPDVMSMGLRAGESYYPTRSGNAAYKNAEARREETLPEREEEDFRDSREPSRKQAKRGKPDREDGIRRSQRLLLTWLIEKPELFDKVKGIITADDFVEDLYHQVAKMVFEGHEAGNVNPAGILSRFINDEDQYKEVAALFNASLKESLSNENRKRLF